MASLILSITKHNMSSSFRLFSIGILVVIVLSFYAARRIKCSEVVEAQIEDIQVVRGNKGSYYKPVFRYYYNGNEYVTVGMGASMNIYKKYTSVKIRIAPDDPEQILDPLQWKANIMMFGPIVAVLLIFAIRKVWQGV